MLNADTIVSFIIIYTTVYSNQISQQSVDLCRAAYDRPAHLPVSHKTLSRNAATIIAENLTRNTTHSLYTFTENYLLILESSNPNSDLIVRDFKSQAFERIKIQSIRNEISGSEHGKYVNLYRLLCSPDTEKSAKRMLERGLTTLQQYLAPSSRIHTPNIYFIQQPIASCDKILHARRLKLGTYFFTTFSKACE